MSTLYRVLAFMLALICAAQPIVAQEAPKVVEATTVKATTITKSVKLIGLIKANKEAHVTSSISGVVQSVSAKEGEQVQKGTLLASLNKPEFKRGSEAAESNARVYGEQYERSAKLFEAEVISKEALESSRAAWSNAKIAAAAAEAQRNQSEFRAPFDGVCGVFKVNQGTYVNPGDEIVTFYDPSEIMVEFSVPEVLINKLKVSSEAMVNKQVGKIVSVQRAIDPTTYMGLARASISKCDECLVGSYVDVGVVVDKQENVVGVPAEALFLKNGVQQVYVVRKGKAVLSPVTIGLRGDVLVEITKGVVVGDVVVTRGQNKLNDGADVKVAQ